MTEEANSNCIILDRKGELYNDTVIKYLENKGYTVKVLNLKNPERSCRYNPFAVNDKIQKID